MNFYDFRTDFFNLKHLKKYILAIGADILDSTYQNTFSFGRLKEEPTWFELDRLQRKHFESIKTFNEYLREEYHSLQDLLWNSGQSSLFGELPKR
jgi:hypothetical protein